MPKKFEIKILKYFIQFVDTTKFVKQSYKIHLFQMLI